MTNLIKKIQMLWITNTEIWHSHQKKRLIENKTKGEKNHIILGVGVFWKQSPSYLEPWTQIENLPSCNDAQL